jgi:hypothetical protein
MKKYVSSTQQGSAGGMPVLILKEGKPDKGRDAQKNNITAALISEIVRTV